MNSLRLTLLVMLAALCAGGPLHAAQEGGAPDGTLLSSEACPFKRISYADWLDTQKKEYVSEAKSSEEHDIAARPFSALLPELETQGEFRRRRAYGGSACERITYASDGLEVTAYIWRPEHIDGKKLPLVIFNRGGGQELGKLVPWERDGFYDFLQNGFVVIGSQYRGNDGGDGHDEEGGGEVRDIVNLVPLARALGYVDMNNVFMMGESRGAMMTYLAMRAGMKINAAVSIGGETDLAANLQRRPELRDGYSKNIPGFDADPEGTLKARSAILWPEEISAPLLLMHGGGDWRVPAAQDLAFAAKLDALRKPYELVVFEGDVHPVWFHWRERDRRTIDWFKRHMKQAPSNK